MEEYKVGMCVILVLLILYFLLVPSKAQRLEYQANQALVQKRKTDIRERVVAELIGIQGIMAYRGDSTTILTNTQLTMVHFTGIAKGYIADTVFIVVDVNGKIHQYANETLAQNAFKIGDYGITAFTMTNDSVTTRNILPQIIQSENAFNLQYNFIFGAK